MLYFVTGNIWAANRTNFGDTSVIAAAAPGDNYDAHIYYKPVQTKSIENMMTTIEGSPSKHVLIINAKNQDIKTQ